MTTRGQGRRRSARCEAVNLILESAAALDLPEVQPIVSVTDAAPAMALAA